MYAAWQSERSTALCVPVLSVSVLAAPGVLGWAAHPSAGRQPVLPRPGLLRADYLGGGVVVRHGRVDVALQHFCDILGAPTIALGGSEEAEKVHLQVERRQLLGEASDTMITMFDDDDFTGGGWWPAAGSGRARRRARAPFFHGGWPAAVLPRWQQLQEEPSSRSLLCSRFSEIQNLIRLHAELISPAFYYYYYY